MCNKTTCGSLSLYPPIHLCVLSFTDLFARKLQLPWVAGQGLFDSVQCEVSFKLRNRNLTLALIFQKCQLKNFKSKSAKKTRKYFKIVTFGEWDDSDVTRPSAVLLPPYPAVHCLSYAYAADMPRMRSHFLEFQMSRSDCYPPTVLCLLRLLLHHK